jgi:hypothetical protein
MGDGQKSEREDGRGNRKRRRGPTRGLKSTTCVISA